MTRWQAWSERLQWAGAASCAAAFYLGLRGYNFAVNNHHDQVLPFILRLLDPSAFPADPYLATFPYYPSLFPHLAAALSRALGGLSRSMALLYAANVAGLSLALLSLTKSLFDRPGARALAVGLVLSCEFLNIDSFFGEDALWRSYADATSLAWTLLLWALALWLRGGRLSALGLTGLAANLNPLPAAQMGLVFACAWAAPGEKPLGARLRELARGLAAAAAAAAPMAWRLLRMPGRAAAGGAEALDALKAWYPFHYFPETWPAGKWAQAASFLALYGYLMATARPETRRKLAPLVCGALALLAAGFLARWSGSFSLIRLQFFRIDVLLILAGTLLIAERAADGLGKGPGEAIGAALLAASVTVWNCWPLALLALAAQTAGEHAREGKARTALWAAVLPGALWSLWRAFEGKAAPFSPLLALALAGAAAAALAPAREPPRRKLWAAAALALAFLPIARLFAGRLLDTGLSNFRGEARDSEREWKALGAWCRERTPPGSRFIVPPEAWGFRSVSSRSAVFQWIDGAAIHWDPAFAGPWTSRLADFHATGESLLSSWEELGRRRHPLFWSPQGDSPPAPLDKGFELMTPAEFRRLGAASGARYLLTESRHPTLPFPLLLRGRFFLLYRLT